MSKRDKARLDWLTRAPAVGVYDEGSQGWAVEWFPGGVRRCVFKHGTPRQALDAAMRDEKESK